MKQQKMTLNAETIKALWDDQSGCVCAKFADAAQEYADCVATCEVTGGSLALMKVAFECALATRNTMLNAIANDLLNQAAPEVQERVVYLQWEEGLITHVECIRAL